MNNMELENMKVEYYIEGGKASLESFKLCLDAMFEDKPFIGKVNLVRKLNILIEGHTKMLSKIKGS